MPLVEARRIALELRVALDRGDEPRLLARAASPSMTLSEAWARFIAHKRDIERLSPKTLRVYGTNWDGHIAAPRYGIAGMPLEDVQRQHVVQLQRAVVASSRARHEKKLEQARASGSATLAKLERQGPYAGNGIANRVLAQLSSLYSWAVNEGIAQTNPCEGVASLPEVGRDKETVLTRTDALEVVELIRQHAPSEAVRDALLLVVLTIQRDSDIRERDWSDLVLDDPDVPMPYLRIGTHKSSRRTKQAKVVPLAPEALAILLARHPGSNGIQAVQRDGGWVVSRGTASWPLYPSSSWAGELRPAKGPIFARDRDPTRPLADLWHGWEPCRKHARSKRVKVADVHGLRHAGASLMRAAGVPLELIGDALHHADGQTTAIYLAKTFEFYQALGTALGGGLGVAGPET